jgi:hypothetical protein
VTTIQYICPTGSQIMEIRLESRDLDLHREIMTWIGKLLLCNSI